MVLKKAFIIPYRNRQTHRNIFLTHMRYILEDECQDEYIILFIHQNDKRPFNRGAIKNIGFIWLKENYPEQYKNITIIFHDIDTLPKEKNLFSYNTTLGTVKHFYGFQYCFGGIFAIKGKDFERINGFPNFWDWGYEDNAICHRWKRIDGKIDFSQFIPIHDERVGLLFHGQERSLNKSNEKFENDKTGIFQLKKIQMKKNTIEIAEKLGMNNVFEIDVAFFTDGVPRLIQKTSLLEDMKSKKKGNRWRLF